MAEQTNSPNLFVKESPDFLRKGNIFKNDDEGTSISDLGVSISPSLVSTEDMASLSSSSSHCIPFYKEPLQDTPLYLSFKSLTGTTFGTAGFFPVMMKAPTAKPLPTPSLATEQYAAFEYDRLLSKVLVREYLMQRNCPNQTELELIQKYKGDHYKKAGTTVRNVSNDKEVKTSESEQAIVSSSFAPFIPCFMVPPQETTLDLSLKQKPVGSESPRLTEAPPPQIMPSTSKQSASFKYPELLARVMVLEHAMERDNPAEFVKEFEGDGSIGTGTDSSELAETSQNHISATVIEVGDAKDDNYVPMFMPELRGRKRPHSDFDVDVGAGDEDNNDEGHVRDGNETGVGKPKPKKIWENRFSFNRTKG